MIPDYKIPGTDLVSVGCEPAQGGKPNKVLILLHGYGSNGDDLSSLFAPLSYEFPSMGFLSPHGKDPCPLNPMGRQWFDLYDLSLPEITRGADKCYPVLAKYVDCVADAFDMEHRDIILGGFSQGGMMALTTGLKMESDVGGILSFSGGLPNIEWDPDKNIPIYLSHGTNDPVVPFDYFKTAGVKLSSMDLHTFSDNSEHTISMKSLQKAVKFLKYL